MLFDLRLLPIAALALTLGAVHFPALFSGLARTDASTAAIMMQLQVPFAVLMAALLLGDRPGWRAILGIMIAFAGVVVIVGSPRLDASRVGLGLLLLAAFAWAIANVQLKKLGPIEPFSLNGWLAVFATGALLILSYFLEGPIWPQIVSAGWRGWTGVLYMGLVSTIVGYGLWFRLVSRYSVVQTMPFLLTIPLFAVLSGILLNGDHLTIDVVVGGLITTAGVAIVVVWRPAPLVGRPAEAP